MKMSNNPVKREVPERDEIFICYERGTTKKFKSPIGITHVTSQITKQLSKWESCFQQIVGFPSSFLFNQTPLANTLHYMQVFDGVAS